MKLYLFLAFFVLSSSLVYSQNEQISGETDNGQFRFRNNGNQENNGIQFLLGHNNTGFAAYYLDASNGDFTGLDYALLKHKDNLDLELVNFAASPIYFKNGGDSSANTRIAISSTGDVGIGTENPNTKLHVTNGDVFIEDIDKGVIMKSPDGNCWRMTVDNSGNIKTESITCPQ